MIPPEAEDRGSRSPPALPPMGVVLLDFGGPEQPAEVRPFLRRMFQDPAILPLPAPLRFLLAWIISWQRAPHSLARYRQVADQGLPGSEDEILSAGPAWTRLRAVALQDLLGNGFVVRCAFRYTQPFAGEALAELATMGVRQVVALPLFPQRSWTTTDSCMRVFARAARRLGMRWVQVPSFPDHPALVQVMAQNLQPLAYATDHVVFVAHGLPERNERRGDPYVSEVRRSVTALLPYLPPKQPWTLAFQSRIGPVDWVGPYLDQVIAELGLMKVRSITVMPLSFLSDNLETLYDLDLEAAKLAQASGIGMFRRAPCPGNSHAFMSGLAQMVRETLLAGDWHDR